jgi:hypothetical protein
MRGTGLRVNPEHGGDPAIMEADRCLQRPDGRGCNGPRAVACQSECIRRGRPLAMKRILKDFIDRAIENAAKHIKPPSAVGQIPIRWGSCGESG